MDAPQLPDLKHTISKLSLEIGDECQIDFFSFALA